VPSDLLLGTGYKYLYLLTYCIKNAGAKSAKAGPAMFICFETCHVLARILYYIHLVDVIIYIYIYIFSFFLNLFTFLPLDLIVLYEYCCLGGKRHLVCKKSLENAGIWSFRWLLKNWSYVFVTVQCMDDVNKEQCLHHTEMYTVSHKKFATWYLFVTFIDVDKFSRKFLVFLPVNLLRGLCHISLHTCNASLHYLLKNIISKIAKFWHI